MTLLVFTTENRKKKVRKETRLNAHFLLLLFAFIFSRPISAQKVSVLVPDRTDTSYDFAERLENHLAINLTVLDRPMGEAVFSSTKPDAPFNMTAETSRALGTAIGGDYFILVKSETLRRSSSKLPLYYESYAAIYVVSSRTGRLVFWNLPRFEASKQQDSQNRLFASIPTLATDLITIIKKVTRTELAEPPAANMEEPPSEDSPLAKNFRPPVPYRRVKPEYTAEASLFDIRATVDIIVDLNAQGSILRTEIVRWAGYGLDESAEKAVRAMNWRPAERNGKSLPMRFLLRYNFKKIDKE